MPYEREDRRSPRQLTEQDVERIARDAAKEIVEQELLAGFNIADLLKEGKPNWRALTPVGKTDWEAVEELSDKRKKRAALKELFIKTVLPWVILGSLAVLVRYIEIIWAMLGSLISALKGGGGQS